MSGPVAPHPVGAVLRVRVLPAASAARIVGVVGDELRIRVCSPPVDGRANEEVVALLAEVLGLKRRQIQLVAGHASRSKRLVVEKADAELQRWIDTMQMESSDR